MDAKDIADALAALLTPIIGLIAAYIAYQQYKTNKHRDRREARQAQLSTYTRVKRFLNHVDTTREISEKAYSDITEAVAEADFLFDDVITDWLSELQAHADEYRRVEDAFISLRMHHKMFPCSLEDLRKRDPENYALLEKEQSAAIDQLQNAHCHLKEKFSKYLKI